MGNVLYRYIIKEVINKYGMPYEWHRWKWIVECKHFSEEELFTMSKHV